MCGEKFVVLVQAAVIVGSPPRVRGKAPTLPKWATVVGITPACAGKSRSFSRLLRDTKDHPRVCGEKSQIQEDAAKTPGSPPRVRGKDKLAKAYKQCLGITPACAGKRSAKRATLQPSRDHPRVCGEKGEITEEDYRIWGSPPRVRGKEQHDRCENFLHGITPACAGKSSLSVLVPCA